MGREALQGLEATSEVVGGDEVSRVRAQLIVGGVVEPLDRRLLDGAVHPLDLPVVSANALWTSSPVASAQRAFKRNGADDLWRSSHPERALAKKKCPGGH